MNESASKEQALAPPTMATPVFIVGTGRCGSTLLGRLLGAHPALLNVSEFFSSIGPERIFDRPRMTGVELVELLGAPAPDYEHPLIAGSIPEVGPKAPAIASSPQKLPAMLLVTLPELSEEPLQLYQAFSAYARTLPLQDTPVLLSKLFDWLCRSLGRRFWFERSGGSLQYLDRIMDFWPDSRLIHIWRDGPECALSLSRHAYFRVAVARAIKRRNTLSVDDCFAERLNIDRFGAYWSAAILKGTRQLARAERSLSVSLADLRESPSQCLEQIAFFLGIDADQDWLRRASSQVRPVPERLPSLDVVARLALERACSPGMRALGRDRRSPKKGNGSTCVEL